MWRRHCVFWFVGIVHAGSVCAQQINYNAAQTNTFASNRLQTDGQVDDFGTPGGAMTHGDLQNTLITNPPLPMGPFDWGNLAISSSNDGNVASSADGFLTMNGDATADVLFRWSSDALLDSSPPTAGAFTGFASSMVDMSIVLTLSGLSPGQPYAFLLDWTTDLSAGAPRSPALAGTSAQSFASISGPNLSPPFTAIVNANVSNSIQDAPPETLVDGGSIAVGFVAAAASEDVVLHLLGYAGASWSGPPNHDDLLGATGYSSLRMRLVPEPHAAAGLLLLSLLGSRIRRGNVDGAHCRTL